MPIQKVLFLYCSPSGEKRLHSFLQSRIDFLPPEDGKKTIEFFANAIHKGPEGHSFRVWFHTSYPDASPGQAALEDFIKRAPGTEIYFARIGEEPDDAEEVGCYESIRLPKME